MNIKDIARIANVSPSTVSKIVNGKDAAISDKTREKVMELVNRYHYRAYSANTTHTKHWLIGVILRSSISSDTTLDGIIKTAQAAGYGVVVFNSFDDEQQESTNITSVRSQNVDGIIWEPVSESSLKINSDFNDRDIPLLTIGPFGGNKTFLMPYEEAAYDLTLELIERGHRHIGCLLNKGRRTDAFLNGYKRCLFEHEMPYDKTLVYYDLNKTMLTEIGNHHLTGFISSHYHTALEFSHLMESFHYRIPADISLASIKNDTNEVFNYLTYGTNISTYTIRNADFGSFICRKLIAQMENTPEASLPEHDFHLDNTSSIDIPSRMQTRKILVVGNLNTDIYLSVPQLPREGTTVPTQSTSQHPGGNGINQAIGAAKLGHDVSLIGNVGSDSDSDYLFTALHHWNIDTSGVHRATGTNTGKAYMFLAPNGDSMVSVIAGANASLTKEDIRKSEALFDDAAYCLLQSEIPLEAISTACELAHKHRAKVIFKLSSDVYLPNELIAAIDIFVLNAQELDIMEPEEEMLQEKTQRLQQRGAQCIIVTQGENGCYLFDHGTEHHYAAAPLAAVDTTGAGDAFVSALASYLLYGYKLPEATSVATYAAGFSTTREGGIPSLIDKFTLESHLERIEKENRK